MKLTTLVLALIVSLAPTSSSQEKPAPPARSQALAAERRELAEIRLALGAERAYADAKARLARLAATLGARSDAEARALLADVEGLQDEVRLALGEAPAQASGGQDAIDTKVHDALLTSDYDFLRQLGKRAVPGLSEAVRSDPDRFPGDASADPLTHLFAIDPLATDRLCTELLAQDGFFWKKRVTRLITPSLADQRALWSADTPRRWLGPGFLATLEKYAEDEDVGDSALSDLLWLVRAGARSQALDGTLARALRSPDAVRRQLAGDLAQRCAPGVGQAFFEALLEAPEADLRALASRVLLEDFPQSRAFLAHVGDAEAQVRAGVAAYLRFQAKTDWDAAELAAGVQLLHDEDPAVRRVAAEALRNMGMDERKVRMPAEQAFDGQPVEYSRYEYQQPLPAEAYRDLAPDAVAGLIALAPGLPVPQCFELVEVAARTPSDGDRKPAFFMAVARMPFWEDPRRALQTLGTVLDAGELRSLGEHHLFFREFARTRAGLSALVGWLIERDDETLRPIFGMPLVLDDRIGELAPELVARWIARLYRFDKNKAFEAAFVRADLWSPARAAALRELARGGAQPVGLRALALGATLRRGEADADLRALGTAVVDAPAWRASKTLGADESYLASFLEHCPGELADELILRLLGDPALPDALAARVAMEVKGGAPGAGEVIALVLEHGLGKSDWWQAVKAATEEMVAGEYDPALLERLARDPSHGSLALEAMGRLRDPRHLPFLAGLVNAPRNADELERAARALCGYLDEGAVEPLLSAAARVEDGETRDRCLAQLEKICEYLDAKERWARGRVAERTRAEVVADLMAQLDAKSDDVKVQAMRALATWEALEAMPRLIELSVSGSKSVAAAAREALERLNAGRPEKKD